MAIGDPDGEAALAEIRDAARNKLGQNTSAYNELSQLSRNLGSGSEEQEGQVTHESHKIHTVVDTANELGGFGATPRPSLGRRDMTRLQVNTRGELFEVMQDAVQNHSARVVVIDEIRDTEEEATTQTK